MALLILVAAVVIILNYIESGADSDLPKKIQAISKAGDITTERTMRSLQQEVVAYMAEHGGVPESLERIYQMNRHLRGISDVWGTPIRYRRISDSSFLLLSAGKDMRFNSPDDIVLEY